MRSDETVLLSTRLGYQITEVWSISAEVFNLLDNTDHEIDYFYTSRITPSEDPVDDVHFPPVDPISFRAALTAKF